MMLNDELSINLPLQNIKGQRIMQRAKYEIKGLQEQNEMILKQIERIKMNPHQIIQANKKKVIQKIKCLKRQNQGISLILQKSKYPGVIHLTKKKNNPITPQKNNYQQEQNLLQNDEYDNYQQRNNFHEQNNQKYQASTCHNYNCQVQDPIQSLQPLQDNQLRNRTILTAQVLQVVQRSKHFKQEMQQIQKTNQKIGTSKYKKNVQKYRCLQHQKRKLLVLLQKLKSRQRNMNQLTNQYKLMHEETIQKLKEANQVLCELQQSKVQNNIDDVYAQVMQLQERLNYINNQLQQLDQSGWLQQIYQELKKAILRIGLKIPHKIGNQNIKENIDQLCQILIQCNLIHKNNQNDKINFLKYYHEEQKKTNKQVIQKLKEKQQILSKQLVQIQIVINKP